MASHNTPRPTKAERTAAAREKARQLHLEQQRREKRNGLLVRWGIVAAVVAIIAIVAVIVSSNARSAIPDAGPSPRYGNENGGIQLTSPTALVEGGAGEVNYTTLPEPSTPAAGAEAEPPSGVAAAPAGEPAQIVVYIDFACSHCKDFEAANAAQLETWLAAGDATVEYRSVAYLDNPATGNYSSRAANAAACVADAAPEQYLGYVSDLFERQSTAGYSNDELVGFAEELGVQGISDCVEGNQYRPYVKYTDQLARVDAVRGTPDVWVDGQSWAVANQDFVPWAQGIIDARGA